MNKILRFLIITISVGFIGINSLYAVGSAALSRVMADTIAFTATKAVSEVDPNNGNYCFTLEGTANATPWKMQIDYYADSLTGTITDTEFRLPKAGGSSTNWIRKNDGSYKTYYGYSLQATVTENDGVIGIALSGLYRENKGIDTTWHYVDVVATILPIQPKNTTLLDLGQVAVVPNTFLGYLIMEAENTDYRLAFGVSGISELRAGTFYRTEMIRPDLVEKATGDTVKPIFAQLEVRDSTVSGLYRLELDIYDTDSNLYHIGMHTDVITVKDTVEIRCHQATLTNVVAEYNMYQMVGAADDYQVALAVKPGVIRESMTVIPNDSVDLSFTQVLRLTDNALIRVQHAEATVSVDSTSTVQKQTVMADLIGTNGTLYRVTMNFGGSDMPTATDTVYVECGDGIGRMDYTKDEGWMGMVVVGDTVDVHITFYHGYELKGSFDTDYFRYESESYVTTYGSDGMIRFADIVAAQMRLDSIGDTLTVSLDVVTVTGRMYRFSAWMGPKFALTGPECIYSTDYNGTGARMIALRLAHQGNTSSYRLQLQRADSLTAEGEIIGDGEIWDFRFATDTVDGIRGEYGLVAGDLEADPYHTLYEGNTEILIKPAAELMRLQPVRRIEVELGGSVYRTCVYQIGINLVGMNNIIYRLSGVNFLLCLDNETDTMLELSEGLVTQLEQARTAEEANKILQQGRVVIVRGDRRYGVDGREL